MFNQWILNHKFRKLLKLLKKVNLILIYLNIKGLEFKNFIDFNT